MRYSGLLALTLILARAAFAADPQTDDEKAFYALGVGLSKQLVQLQPLTPEEIGFLTSGLSDALGNKPPKADPEKF